MVRSKSSSFSKLAESSNSHDPSTVNDTASIEHDQLPSDTTFDNDEDILYDEDHDGLHEISDLYGDDPLECILGLSPARPMNIHSSSARSRWKSSGLDMRDNLLAEAWERKKELMLQDELANLKEYPTPHLLGRSASDCGTSTATAMTKHQLPFERSTSDVGKCGSPLLTKPRIRLTDDDFEELKGFIDLGFRFDETSLPAFGHTLPALEVYCAVAQSLQESPYCPSPPQASPSRSSCGSMPSTSPWRVCSPGDAPEEVKGRLRHWAQAVACNVRLCS